jgi:PhzF family phenazine biosynthesis protein
MAMNRTFQLVDVFGDKPCSGNPLAVVADADELGTDEMRSITRWLNLSETTFLLKPIDPQADYRVRIFSLDRELPFAGHPTLGTCHAWLVAGGKSRSNSTVVQECAAGLVQVKNESDMLFFRAPTPLREGPVDPAKSAEIAKFLGVEPAFILDAQWVDNGPGWAVALLESAEAVMNLTPARMHETRLDLGVVGPHPPGSPLSFELRAFFTESDGAVREDPVTGSLNAAVAQWLLRTGRASAPYVASQGTCLGRTGRVFVRQDEAGDVWVGGKTVSLVSGSFGGAPSRG